VQRLRRWPMRSFCARGHLDAASVRLPWPWPGERWRSSVLRWGRQSQRGEPGDGAARDEAL